MVFPLGMYSTCTFELVKIIGLDFLYPMARGFGYAAFLAWLLTLAALGWKAMRELTTPRAEL